MANGTNGKAQVLADLVTSASSVIVVVVALTALGFMTSYIVSALDSQDAKLAVATTALGVIGAIVGAFFGVKVAGDSSKSAQEQTTLKSQQAEELQRLEAQVKSLTDQLAAERLRREALERALSEGRK